MGVRLPLQTVLDYDDTTNAGATSVSGGVAKTFNIPQDTDNIILKFTASLTGSASAVLQTTDDGGTTWYDVARTSVVSNANNTIAEFISAPVVGQGLRTQKIFGGSILSATVGSAAASTLGQSQQSGLPILSPLNRAFIIYTSGTSAGSLARVQVKVNSQSGTAS